jgi:hypothetical protein
MNSADPSNGVGRKEAEQLMLAFNRTGFGAALAMPAGPDTGEKRERPAFTECEPDRCLAWRGVGVFAKGWKGTTQRCSGLSHPRQCELLVLRTRRRTPAGPARPSAPASTHARHQGRCNGVEIAYGATWHRAGGNLTLPQPVGETHGTLGLPVDLFDSHKKRSGNARRVGVGSRRPRREGRESSRW